MHKVFLKTAVQVGFSLALIVAAVALVLGRFAWAGGELAGASWMFLNFYFLYRLIAIGLGKDPKNKMLFFSVMKFPALYLLGYFVLQTRYFPIGSILTGLTMSMVGLGAAWVLFQKTENREQRTENRFPAEKYFMVFFFVFILSSVLCPLFSVCYASTSHEGEGGSSLHTTNLVGLVSRFLPESLAEFLKGSENIIFGVIVIAILSMIFYFASKNMKLVPGRLQSACEAVVETLNDFVCGIIGPDGRKYTPFLGTLFLYIWTMNLLGLVPLMKSNTANSMTLSGPIAIPIPTTTVALALIVFVAVQAIGIKKQGILGYLDHMAGSPRDVFGVVMAPLMFPIHLIGELAKPFSLTFRLFCNTMGGHILVAVFIGMGVTSMFIPFQTPFLIFEIATSTIQAFVFTLLSTVYIAMMLPHGEGHEEKAH